MQMQYLCNSILQSGRWNCSTCSSEVYVWHAVLDAGTQGEVILWQHGSMVELEFPARGGKVWEGQYSDHDGLIARWGPPGVRGVWSGSGRSLTWRSGEEWSLTRDAWLCRRCGGAGRCQSDKEQGLRNELDGKIADVKRILNRRCFEPSHLPAIRRCLYSSAALNASDLKAALDNYMQVQQDIPIRLGNIRWTQRTISPVFCNGRPLQELVADLKSGRVTNETRNMKLEVAELNGSYWSKDNRRLHCFVQAFGRDHEWKCTVYPLVAGYKTRSGADYLQKFIDHYNTKTFGRQPIVIGA